MRFECSYDELVPLGEIKPNPKNRNAHPKEQIERLAKIIEAHGQRRPIIISTRSGMVTVGHGRLEALKLLGWDKAAVDYQDYATPEEEFADSVADNAVAFWAELDLSGIHLDMKDFGPFDVGLLGIKDFQFEPAQITAAEEDLYTKKVNPPIYEPRGDKPKVGDLFDRVKAETLLDEIDKSDIPSDVANFLRAAALRHTVFNYEKIAEFYAHAPVDVQNLMERSALVIIDFKKAIENGFVVLCDELAEAYTSD